MAAKWPIKNRLRHLPETENSAVPLSLAFRPTFSMCHHTCCHDNGCRSRHTLLNSGAPSEAHSPKLSALRFHQPQLSLPERIPVTFRHPRLCKYHTTNTTFVNDYFAYFVYIPFILLPIYPKCGWKGLPDPSVRRGKNGISGRVRRFRRPFGWSCHDGTWCTYPFPQNAIFSPENHGLQHRSAPDGRIWQAFPTTLWIYW